MEFGEKGSRKNRECLRIDSDGNVAIIRGGLRSPLRKTQLRLLRVSMPLWIAIEIAVDRIHPMAHVIEQKRDVVLPFQSEKLEVHGTGL